METSLYSIGHGQKDIEEFYNELLSFGIQYVIDVRSNPFSKWAPQYNQQELSLFLNRHNIIYVYMGDTIGGRPNSDSCYDDEGYYDYEKMAEVPAFQTSLGRLVSANEQQFKVAIMCSESDPSQCHRSKLIGRELYDKHHINMKHILEPNKFIDECNLVIALTKGAWNPNSLFGEEPMPHFKSRKSYKEETENFSVAYD